MNKQCVASIKAKDALGRAAYRTLSRISMNSVLLPIYVVSNAKEKSREKVRMCIDKCVCKERCFASAVRSFYTVIHLYIIRVAVSYVGLIVIIATKNYLFMQ